MMERWKNVWGFERAFLMMENCIICLCTVSHVSDRKKGQYI